MKNTILSIPTKDHASTEPMFTRVLLSDDLLKLEMRLLYDVKHGKDRQFELFYMFVSCSDCGVVRNRKHTGAYIRRTMGMSRVCYDSAVDRLKAKGLIELKDGVLCIPGVEWIDWKNQHNTLLVKQNHVDEQENGLVCDIAKR